MIRAQVYARRWQRAYPATFITHNGDIDVVTRVWAALLFCRRPAIASHRTAGYLCGLLDQPPRVIEISVPAARRPRGAPGVVIYRRRIMVVGTGQPLHTSVEDTVLDLIGQTRRPDRVVGLLTTACQRRLTTASRLVLAVASRPHLRWRSLVADVLNDDVGVQSTLEWRYLHDVERAHGLPRGARQVRVVVGRSARWRDVEYLEYGVVVELDGAAAHPDEMRHRDMNRDNDVVASGRRALRYGWQDVSRDPCDVAVQVARVLADAGWQGMPRPCGPNCRLRGPIRSLER